MFEQRNPLDIEIEEGDLVAAVTDLAHRHTEGRDVIPASTCGIVAAARPGAQLVRVDFGAPGGGVRWVARASLRVVEEQVLTSDPATSDAVGALWDVVAAQSREIARLQDALSGLLKNEAGAAPRLARTGSDD